MILSLNQIANSSSLSTAGLCTAADFEQFYAMETSLSLVTPLPPGMH